MCGICGIWHHGSRQAVEQDQLEQMKSVMVRRGPDDEGSYIGDQGRLGLGFRRLAIIDIANGHQPMSNADESLWIVFNGEIYNHNELRETLKQRGCRFKTRTDTEVLIYAYQEYGKDCVHKLRGMFAFAIWDVKKQHLFAARDRLGIKPFYYYHDNERFSFASELKSLRISLPQPPELNLQSLERFFTYRYVPGPETMWQNVYKLQPGHRMQKTPHSFRIERYWQADFSTDTTISLEEAKAKTQELLMQSIKIRLQADVPVGVLLSGGLDSSTILALSQAQTDTLKAAFTIGFKEANEYDETPYAQEIAQYFGIEHHVLKIDAHDLIHQIEEYIHIQDEPLADPTGIPLYLICQKAKESVTVLLSGEGADEIFSGYDRYKMANLLSISSTPLFAPARWLSSALSPMFKSGTHAQRISSAIAGKDMAHSWHALSSLTAATTRRALLTPDIDHHAAHQHQIQRLQNHIKTIKHPLNQMQMLDIQTWLPENMLTKNDRMTMAASIEARVPFLDHKLVEFGLKLPPDMRMHNRQSKWIIRQIMQNKLPQTHVQRRKTGWPMPLDDWFRNDMKQLAADTLLGETCKQRGIFQPAAMRSMLEQHWAGKAHNGRQLFMALCMEMWLRQNR